MNAEPKFDVDATTMNRNAVLRNLVLFGTVNAGRRHWEQAVDALATADPAWLRRMISRRVPLTSWSEALDRPTRRHQGRRRSHSMIALTVVAWQPGSGSTGLPC